VGTLKNVEKTLSVCEIDLREIFDCRHVYMTAAARPSIKQTELSLISSLLSHINKNDPILFRTLKWCKTILSRRHRCPTLSLARFTARLSSYFLIFIPAAIIKALFYFFIFIFIYLFTNVKCVYQ
jgi:hypothetical protein